MIDLHCHLLPGVDDGAKTLDDALKMLELAYNDGVRTIVCTPHYHHPLSFDETTYEAVFQSFENSAKSLYPDVTLIFGGENYISRKPLHDLEGFHLATIGDSHYVLVEFARGIRMSELEQALHHIQHKGYTPIVAHVEMYPNIYRHQDDLCTLKKEGVLFQCNAENIIDKKHRAGQHAKTYLDLGLVDFITSDAHDTIKRPPLLSQSKRLITRRMGKEAAYRLFEGNGLLVIQNQVIETRIPVKPNKVKPPSGKLIASGFVMTLGVMLSAIVIMGSSQFLQNRTVEPALSIPENPQPITTQYPDPMDATSPNEVSTSDEKPSEGEAQALDMDDQDTQSYETASEIPTETPTETPILLSPVNDDHELDLIQAYVTFLEGLEARLLNTFESYYEEVEMLYNAGDKTVLEERLTVIENDLIALEVEVDYAVNKTLYDFQNDLEYYEYDTAIIKTLRSQYFVTKSEVTQNYIDQLKSIQQ